MSRVEKRKLAKKKSHLMVIFFVFLICIAFSLFNIIKWYIENNRTKNLQDIISSNTKVENVLDNSNTEIVAPSSEISNSDSYYDYIKMTLLNVDFSELKSINPDTVGWLMVDGTNINYPFVQSSNNEYYLTHSFDGKYSSAGWVFLDYRNSTKQLDKNTIIYAHSRLNKTMFGSLKNILDDEWLNNKSNHVIKLSTEYENSLWQVFSVYHIPTTNDYIRTSFVSDDDFLSFTNMLINRSVHNFDTTVDKDDNILTLSTCYKTNEKLVLHAKLLKKESR